jgi:hypothetical protein
MSYDSGIAGLERSAWDQVRAVQKAKWRTSPGRSSLGMCAMDAPSIRSVASPRGHQGARQ